MALIIPSISSCSEKITAGEKRLARLLERGLGDECVCWYDIPMGEKQLYPDFVVLAPDKGMLFIEVKDWYISKIKSANKTHIQYETKEGIRPLDNPYEQARNYTHNIINSLAKDPQLCQQNEKYSGKFILPYGFGAYLSNITRAQLNKAFSAAELAEILPADRVICKDEITEFMDQQAISSRLYAFIKHPFAHRVTQDQIDRIRWHLYPDMRINKAAVSSSENSASIKTPNIISILDTQQELLARSMGAGHRVIHGVAGSGKTLILLHRCLALANSEEHQKPILVTCYNIMLANRLKALIEQHTFRLPVEVVHFHSWCRKQLHASGIEYASSGNVFDNMEKALAGHVDNGTIKTGQYSAVLIDEGHDFKAEWLTVLARMVDEKESALLFLYDDAQSIYQKKKALDFTLASVGIKAQGRTTILDTNYRNTQQILHLASSIAFNYLNTHIDEALQYHQPDAGGIHGAYPLLKHFERPEDEMAQAIAWVKQQHQQGVPWSDIAVLCPSTKKIASALGPLLAAQNIPYQLIVNAEDKKRWTPESDCLCIMPIPGSKGLEFHSVALMDAGNARDENDLSDDLKRLYVGITRARRSLLVTLHGSGALCDHLLATYEQAEMAI